MIPEWAVQMRADLEAAGYDRGTAAWAAAWRDLHAERFPDADPRTRENLQMLAESAAAREAVEARGVRWSTS